MADKSTYPLIIEMWKITWRKAKILYQSLECYLRFIPSQMITHKQRRNFNTTESAYRFVRPLAFRISICNRNQIIEIDECKWFAVWLGLAIAIYQWEMKWWWKSDKASEIGLTSHWSFLRGCESKLLADVKRAMASIPKNVLVVVIRKAFVWIWIEKERNKQQTNVMQLHHTNARCCCTLFLENNKSFKPFKLLANKLLACA